MQVILHPKFVDILSVIETGVRPAKPNRAPKSLRRRLLSPDQSHQMLTYQLAHPVVPLRRKMQPVVPVQLAFRLGQRLVRQRRAQVEDVACVSASTRSALSVLRRPEIYRVWEFAREKESGRTSVPGDAAQSYRSAPRADG